jgi:guanylate kinase
MGKIFIILGKSATGKDTIFKRLLENPELKLNTVVMYTTRPIRVNETEGVEYHFVDEERLRLLQEQGKVIEHRSYQTVHGTWHYFTVNDDQIRLSDHNYLMHGTLESFEQIKRYFGEDRVIPLYIEVEDGTRLLRAIKREMKQEQPKYAELCRRFLADEEDFAEDNIIRAGIKKRYYNDDIELCLKEIEADLKNLL